MSMVFTEFTLRITPNGADLSAAEEFLEEVLEDEEAERQIDLSEVEKNVRSRRNYIEKWNISDCSDTELDAISKEMDLLK